MPFDSKLAERIRKQIANDVRFSEKKMFGGLAFMLDDKMCCGVIEDKLVARIGAEQSERALRKKHVSQMDFTGRPLKGFIYVSSQGLKNEGKLHFWIQESIAFVSTLAKKKTKRRRTVSQLGSHENPRELPLSRLINFGPVTLVEFKEMGLTKFGQLEDLGWESVCRQWVENFPERLNANAFIGVIATLEGVSWTQVSDSDRTKARSLVNQLKQEYGLLTPSAHKRRRSPRLKW